jgi:hypothetical protein
VLNRHYRRQPCVIVHGLARYLERPIGSEDNLSRRRRDFVRAQIRGLDVHLPVHTEGIGYLHLTQHGHKIVWFDLLA